MMRSAANALCLLLLAVLFAACGAQFAALNAPPVNIATGSSPRSITIVSAIGDTFAVQRLGIMVFGNALDHVPIDAWGIDEHVSAKVAAHVGPGAKVIPPRAAREAFATFYKPVPFSDGEERFNTALRAALGQHSSDLVMVVLKSGSQIANTNQSVQGLGLLAAGGLISRTTLFALFHIRVVDGKTLAPIATKIAKARDYNLMTSHIRGPMRDVDKSWWPEPAARVAGDQRVKGAVLELIDEALPTVLAEAVAVR